MLFHLQPLALSAGCSAAVCIALYVSSPRSTPKASAARDGNSHREGATCRKGVCRRGTGSERTSSQAVVVGSPSTALRPEKDVCARCPCCEMGTEWHLCTHCSLSRRQIASKTFAFVLAPSPTCSPSSRNCRHPPVDVVCDAPLYRPFSLIASSKRPISDPVSAPRRVPYTAKDQRPCARSRCAA